MTVIKEPEHDPHSPWDKDGNPKRGRGYPRKYHRRKATRAEAMVWLVLIMIMIIAMYGDNTNRKVLGNHNCPDGYVPTGDRACTPEDLNKMTTYAGH